MSVAGIKKVGQFVKACSMKRALVRGEPVVQGVLDAALEVLAHAGYRGFRIDDVAQRAQVNKTTIYRRWPTKIELVRAAMAAHAEKRIVFPDTGTLRSDLLVAGRAVVSLASAPQGQAIIRVMIGEGSDPEVAELERAVRSNFEALPTAILANAVARGELSPGVDHRVIFDAFFGAIHHRIFMMNETVTKAFLERLVDVILRGAQSALSPDSRASEG
jgi:AcrR family transcriptional regulator